MAGHMPANPHMQFEDVIDAKNAGTTLIHIYNDRNVLFHNALLFDNDVYVGQTTMYQNYNPDNQRTIIKLW